MWATVLLATLTLSVLDCGSGDLQVNGVLEPYDLLFDNAVEAYYKQDWLSVILNMERALKNKGMVRKVRTHCRLACANSTGFEEAAPEIGVPIPGSGAVEDLEFFRRVLKRADCVNACEIEKLGPPTLHKVSDAVELEFKKRTPYNYLQVAYFKVKYCKNGSSKLNQAACCTLEWGRHSGGTICYHTHSTCNYVLLQNISGLLPRGNVTLVIFYY